MIKTRHYTVYLPIKIIHFPVGNIVFCIMSRFIHHQRNMHRVYIQYYTNTVRYNSWVNNIESILGNCQKIISYYMAIFYDTILNNRKLRRV